MCEAPDFNLCVSLCCVSLLFTGTAVNHRDEQTSSGDLLFITVKLVKETIVAAAAPKTFKVKFLQLYTSNTIIDLSQ